MIAATRGAARQLAGGRWIIEVEVDAPTADLLMAPIGAAIGLMLGDAVPAPIPAAAPKPPTQAVGDAGAGDTFTLGGGRTLSTTQEATMRYVMALVAMPPFQQYAQTMLGVENCPDTQVLAQQFVVAQCGNDLLSDQGIAQVRALHQRFRTWSDGLRYALTFHAELP